MDLVQGATIFGESIGVSTIAMGHVIYDPDAVETAPPENCLDCSGYEQLVVGGFLLQFDSTTIWSNVYSVDVFNNQAGLFPGTFEDVIAFDHSGAVLLVNGVATSEAAMTLSLTAPETAFSNTELPSNPQPSMFPFGNIFIEDELTGSFLLGVVEFGSLQRFEIIDGDINLDESVTIADYELWKTNFSSEDTHFGDANRDGAIDAADYTVWRDAFVGPLSTDTSTIVPEPPQATGCLLMLLARVFTKRGSELYASGV